MSSGIWIGVRTLLSVLLVVLALQPGSLWACAACYGQSDSPMAAGMNWGILSLMAVIAVVLGGVAAFFIYLAKRSARAPLLVSPDFSLPHGRRAPVLGHSVAHKHLGFASLQPTGGAGHRCARGGAHSDTVVFSDGMRQIVPGSSPSML